MFIIQTYLHSVIVKYVASGILFRIYAHCIFLIDVLNKMRLLMIKKINY